MKVYIVFGYGSENWTIDNVYLDEEVAEERVEELESLPSYEKCIVESRDTDKSGIAVLRGYCNEVGIDLTCSDFEWIIEEHELKES